VPAEALEREQEIYKEQAQGKPQDIVEKMMAGRIQKYYEEVCLLNQPFVKDSSMTVQDMLGTSVSKMGENIQVRRFARFVLGN
jgi:elongation factor Ts